MARDAVAIAPSQEGGEHALSLDGGDPIRARSVILATGVSWRELEVPGADALVGRGIYYGAARTEALNCQGEHVFLVGGGNSAGQAAMFFANYARKVSLLVRGPSLAASMSHYLIEQLKSKDNIEICAHCRIVRVIGEQRLEAIVVEHRDTGELVTEQTSAVFAFIGADAETGWLPASVIRDEKGFVCTGRDVMDLVARSQGDWPLERDPFLLESSVPGIFAVGDVRHGSIKRVASGVGEGSMAIAFVHQFLAEKKRAGEAGPMTQCQGRPTRLHRGSTYIGVPCLRAPSPGQGGGSAAFSLASSSAVSTAASWLSVSARMASRAAILRW